MTQRRTEDDLRAAFTLAAQDAPTTQDVLARLEASERPTLAGRRRSPIRNWWPVAAVVASVIAVVVPMTIALSHGGSSTASSSSMSGPAAEAGAKAAAGSAAASVAGSTGSGSAVGGPTNGGGPLIPNRPAPLPSAGRTCTPADLAMAIAWTKTATGLTGLLKVTNHTTTACDLAVKPAVYPLGSDGKRLDVQNVMSAEGYAGPSQLLPAATATSTLSWPSWCGAGAGDRADVDWGSGTATVNVAPGPTTPACSSGAPNNISSGWFGPLS